MRKIRNPETEIPLPGFEVFHTEFLETRKEELVTLKASLAEGDFKALAVCGHKWKGFCSPYGFQELGELAILMEEAAKNSSLEECQEILTRIEEYLG